MMKKLLGIVVALLLLTQNAFADIPNVTVSGSISAVGLSTIVPLSGQTTCSVTISGTYTGLSSVIEGSVNNGFSWLNVGPLGTNGYVYANGTSTGNITAFATTNIRYNVTALTTGTVNYIFNCSPAFQTELRKDAYIAAAPLLTTSGGTNIGVIAAAAAGPVVLVGYVARLGKAVITTAGTTGVVTIYNNGSACSGTVLGVIPGTTVLPGAVAGSQPYTFDLFASNGITVCGGTGSPGVTFSWYQ